MYTGGEQLLLKALEYRWGRIITSGVTALATVMLAVFAVPRGGQTFMLAVRHVRADAFVTETQQVPHVSEFGNSTVYQLKYQFEVDEQWHGRRGVFNEAWTELDKPAWDEAARTERLAILYDPADPDNNQPAKPTWWLLGAAVDLIALTGGVAAASLIWLGRVLRRDVFGLPVKRLLRP